MAERANEDRSGWRLGLGAVGFGALVFFVAAPWLSRAESNARQQLRIEAAQSSAQVTRGGLGEMP